MRMKDPVPAVAEVVSCHALPPGRGSARWFNAVLELDVLMPGVAPYRVQRRCNAPSRNWPQPGGRLPVTVDRSDPARLSVRWREVLTPNEAAAATRLAALRESSGSPMPPVSQPRIAGMAKLLRGAPQIRAAMRRSDSPR
jgi:hypothetical protein